MGIVNRRNAVLGWAVWNVGKRFAKKKAKGAVPAVDTSTKRPKFIFRERLYPRAGQLRWRW